jgi:hypothetical protein
MPILASKLIWQQKSATIMAMMPFMVFAGKVVCAKRVVEAIIPYRQKIPVFAFFGFCLVNHPRCLDMKFVLLADSRKIYASGQRLGSWPVGLKNAAKLL